MSMIASAEECVCIWQLRFKTEHVQQNHLAEFFLVEVEVQCTKESG
jgi:hypothetical protein